MYPLIFGFIGWNPKNAFDTEYKIAAIKSLLLKKLFSLVSHWAILDNDIKSSNLITVKYYESMFELESPIY